MKRYLFLLLGLMIGLAPTYSQNALAEGDALFDTGKYTEAKAKYTLWKVNSNDRIAYADQRIGQCDECMRILAVADYLFSSEDYTNAKIQYANVLRINPNDPLAKKHMEIIKVKDSASFEQLANAMQEGITQAELLTLRTKLLQEGDTAFKAGDYAKSSEAFALVFDYSTYPASKSIDTLSGYNAGYVAALAEKYDQAIKYLSLIEDMGYEADGEIYFLLYHAYSGKGNTGNAEKALKEGIQKYPSNSKLIESLIIHYTSSGQDATQIIPLVEKALKNDPNNYIFHFGLGLIYDKLENFDKAIEEFAKAGELNPQDFNSAFNLGITYVRKAEGLLPEINAIPMNEQARYEDMLRLLNENYKKALPHLEHAHKLNPTEFATVDLLKNLYFRFREDSPEMMQNYEKYDRMSKAL